MSKADTKKMTIEIIERNKNNMKSNVDDMKAREYYRGQAVAIAGYAYVLDVLTEQEFIEITNEIWK